MEYKVAAVTDVGNVRQKNEDSLLVCRKMFQKKEAILAVIADGMGGLSHGEWTSKFLTDSLQEWWNKEILPIQTEPNINIVRDMLGFVIENIHKGIRTQMEKYHTNMGTTLSLLFLYDRKYIIYQVGDSRVYLISKKKLIQLTKDQTWCQMEYDAGRMTKEEMQINKKRHVLTNALGSKEQFYTKISIGQVKKGERLLLCSDGYYTYLDEKELYYKPFQRNITKILEQSAERIRKERAEDNFSAILIAI